MRVYWGTNIPLIHVVFVQEHLNLAGNLLMDVPRHVNLEQLATMVKDETFWKEHLRFI